MRNHTATCVAIQQPGEGERNKITFNLPNSTCLWINMLSGHPVLLSCNFPRREEQHKHAQIRTTIIAAALCQLSRSMLIYVQREGNFVWCLPRPWLPDKRHITVCLSVANGQKPADCTGTAAVIGLQAYLTFQQKDLSAWLVDDWLCDRKCLHLCAHTHSLTRGRARTETHTQTCTHRQARTRACRHTHKQRHTHTHTHTHAHSHSNAQTRTQTS